MDSEKPMIAGEAREFLVSLHLNLSEDLQRQQASVRSTLIRRAAPIAPWQTSHRDYLLTKSAAWHPLQATHTLDHASVQQ